MLALNMVNSISEMTRRFSMLPVFGCLFILFLAAIFCLEAIISRFSLW